MSYENLGKLEGVPRSYAQSLADLGRRKRALKAALFERGSWDIVVAPNWAWVSHEADDDAGYSDRPVQEKIGLLLEERT